MLCGKTNKVVWPWRSRLPGNNLLGTRVSPPPARRAVLRCKVNRCWQQCSRQLTAEQLPSNLRWPDAHADIVSQLARPLSRLLYKKGKTSEWGWGTQVLLLEYIPMSTTCPNPNVPPRMLRSEAMSLLLLGSRVPARTWTKTKTCTVVYSSP